MLDMSIATALNGGNKSTAREFAEQVDRRNSLLFEGNDGRNPKYERKPAKHYYYKRKVRSA